MSSLAIILLLLVSNSAARNLKVKAGKDPKGSSNAYQDTTGYHQTGKYMVFAEYTDDACTPKQFKETHGYALGVCQPFTAPGLWWLNYAGTSEKGTFLFYQFFSDEDCTVPVEGEVFPDFPATGYEHWPTGCNNRTDYSKTFKVQHALPNFQGGTLVLQYLTEDACKANDLDGMTGFLLAKKDQCIYVGGASMFANPSSPSPDAHGVILSCSPDNKVTSKAHTDTSCDPSSFKGTYNFTKSDFCVPNKSSTGDILGYVNVKCV